jgi:hypothetical protein
MVPSIVFSGRECRHADKIFAFPARTEFSVTTSIPQVGTTDPNSVRSFTAENGAGTKSEMGKGSEGTEASSGESKNNWLGSCKAHHVGISPQEDRGGTAEEVGAGEGCEEEGSVAVLVASADLLRVQRRMPRQIELAIRASRAGKIVSASRTTG